MIDTFLNLKIGVIPLTTFATSVFISALTEIEKGSEPTRTLVMRAARVTLDAFITGFIAYALVSHPKLQEHYGLQVFGMTTVAGALTFFMPTLRRTAPRAWDAAIDVILNFLAKMLNSKFKTKGSDNE